jgi:hypothetical protein
MSKNPENHLSGPENPLRDIGVPDELYVECKIFGVQFNVIRDAELLKQLGTNRAAFLQIFIPEGIHKAAMDHIEYQLFGRCSGFNAKSYLLSKSGAVYTGYRTTDDRGGVIATKNRDEVVGGI